jgi:hypothetical protein
VLPTGLLSFQATYLLNIQSVLPFRFCLSGCAFAKLYFFGKVFFVFFGGGKKAHSFKSFGLQRWLVWLLNVCAFV